MPTQAPSTCAYIEFPGFECFTTTGTLGTFPSAEDCIPAAQAADCRRFDYNSDTDLCRCCYVPPESRRLLQDGPKGRELDGPKGRELTTEEATVTTIVDPFNCTAYPYPIQVLKESEFVCPVGGDQQPCEDYRVAELDLETETYIVRRGEPGLHAELLRRRPRRQLRPPRRQGRRIGVGDEHHPLPELSGTVPGSRHLLEHLHPLRERVWYWEDHQPGRRLHEHHAPRQRPEVRGHHADAEPGRRARENEPGVHHDGAIWRFRDGRRRPDVVCHCSWELDRYSCGQRESGRLRQRRLQHYWHRACVWGVLPHADD